MIEIIGGRIFDFEAGELGGPSYISVDEFGIEQIHTLSKSGGRVVPVDTRIEETIHAEGCAVLPGFRNNHAHTAMSLLRGPVEDVSIDDWFNKHVWIVEQNLTPEDVYWGTMLGALEMLHAGVTFVSDHYFHMNRAFDAYRETGMRANLAWATFGIGDGVDENFAGAVDFARSHRSESELLTTSLGPHSPYLCPPDFLRRTSETAEKEDLPVHIHVSETREQVARSMKAFGRSPVEVLDDAGILTASTLLAHAYYAGDSDLSLIRERKSAIAHCPKTFMKFGFVSDILERVLRNKIPIALGSDGVVSNNTMSISEAARDAALLAKCATGNAESVPVKEISGLLSGPSVLAKLPLQTRICPGDPPDLILVDLNKPHLTPTGNLASHIIYSLRESDIRTVIVGGRVVVDQGRHRWIDEAKVLRQASEIYRRLSVHRTDRPMQSF